MKLARTYMSDTHACGQVRILDPATVINQRSRAWKVSPAVRWYTSDLYMADVMVFQGGMKQHLYEFMRLAQTNGTPCIYETDDNWFQCPEIFKNEHKKVNAAKDVIRRFMEDADLVTCSTTTLAKALMKEADIKELMVINNAINGEMWDLSKRNRTDDGFIIGWMASPSHILDVPLIRGALCAVFERFPNVRLVTVGSLKAEQIIPEDYLDRVESYSWIDYNGLPDIMANFDIGICPLVDSVWNRCKSEVKWSQYAALGVPTICSDLDPYKEIGETLKPRTNDCQGWYDALCEMITDEGLRGKIAETGRKRFLADYDIRTTYIRWCEAYDRATEIRRGK